MPVTIPDRVDDGGASPEGRVNAAFLNALKALCNELEAAVAAQAGAIGGKAANADLVALAGSVAAQAGVIAGKAANADVVALAGTVANHATEIGNKLSTAGLAAAVAHLWGDATGIGLTFDDDGDPAASVLEERHAATGFHILAKRADGYEGVGVALDNLLVGVKPITPVLGIISEYYPEDPDDSPELPEVAETRANYPLNSEVVLTDAVSLNHEFFLRFPNPLGPIGNGMEGRIQRMTLINTDPAWSALIRLAPFVDGVNRQALWKTGFANVSLAPGDELRVRAEWYNGRVILEHEKRVATWNTIALRSSGAATGTQRTTTGLLAADLVFAAILRNGGSALPFPAGHAYEAPSGAPFETDGRLILTGPRADRLCWERAVADGDLPTGVFSSAGRIATSAWSNIAAVRRWAGFKADSGSSLAHPHLSGPVAPGAMLIGATMAANHALAAEIVPAGAVIDQFHNGGGSPGISFALWHIAGAATHTPAPSTVTSGAQSSVVVEAIPTRSN